MQNKPKRTPWSTGDKVIITAIGVTLLLVLLGVLVYHNLNADPVAVISMPKMPSPNAFDYFVAASNAVIEDKKIGYTISRSHSPSRSNPDDREYSLAEKQALVTENAPALKLLHEGFAYPYQNPPARSFEALFPYYAKFRGIARLLSLEGKVKAANGDLNGAVQSDLDAVQLGEMVPHGSVLIGGLVGISCQAIGRRPLWDSISHLRAPEAKKALQRLEKLQSRQQPFADTLQEEKWLGQAGLLEIFHEASWQKGFASAVGSDDNASVSLRIALVFSSKKRIFDNYTRYMDQAISNARKPYAAKLPEPPMPDDPLNKVLLPVYSGARIKDVENQTRNALLTVALALQAYKQEYGAYPTQLTPLKPTYLTHLPDDSFALSGPLKYRRTRDKYVLYSVGPDGVDNGGEPIFDASKSAPRAAGAYDQRYSVTAESKGDIVAGVNGY